ncbi:hypothetical protein [Senegalia massiliensis]|uniref:Uncharacterized protein n=1 Tax=Senegalia massiliensis TaxID=1720316 RepID=A0A845QUA0_9CLOT|nr:hypothetical protein [Senegalia massiliensis]NBI06105.1 hypothetical protein [Senegalia massiliensis]
MVDVSKLNKNIESLEEEVTNIKKISDIIRKLDKLNNDIAIKNESYRKLINTIKDLNKDINSSIDKNNQYLSNIKASIKEINDNNIEFNKELSNLYKGMESDLLSHLQEVKSENKKLYLEFESILNSKVERSSSDTKVEIRNKTDKVINIINGIREENKSYQQEVNKKLKTNEIISIALLVLLIISIIMQFI